MSENKNNENLERDLNENEEVIEESRDEAVKDENSTNKENKEQFKSKNKKWKKEYKRKKVIPWHTVFLWVAVITVVIATLYGAYKNTKPIESDLEYVEFLEYLNNGEIDHASVVRSQNFFTITLKDGKSYKVINPNYDEFRKELLEAGVKMTITDNTALEDVSSAILKIPNEYKHQY